ncbi:AAA family ATPase [Bosea robiniae]|uniref:Peptidase family M41 n=1 Tax=Bosea robiniae TaxID=1036780 RepID=A0ABY0NZ77_9HYPH|nr:AAA family ATPase [Bosea robiniae]SDG45379.1 Peptidase family M41 [Bosea robiniae]
MSESELPELYLDDDDEPMEETAVVPRPQGLRERYLIGSLPPAARLPRLMIWGACSPKLRREIDIRKTMIAVIETPSPSWSDCLLEAAKVLFRGAVLVSADKALKDKEYTVSDLDLRLAMQSGQSLVILSSKGVAQISPAVRASVDHHVQIPPPTPAQITATIRATFGNKSVSGVPARVGHHAPAAAILAAIRPGENAARAVARLVELNRWFGQVTASGIPAGPALEELQGYGDAKIWGLELAADIAAYRAGELKWSAISSAAVLYGPPGSGKTYFASALARSCDMHLVATNLGAMFNATEGYLHNIVRQISDAFAESRRKAPSLLFIDELDSIPDRTSLDRRHRDYWTTIVNHLLKLIDNEREGVVVLGATNLIDRIDSAILRAGRLERHFEIGRPGEADLIGMFRLHLGDDLPDADLQALARFAFGSTAAEVELAVRTARGTARREDRELALADLLAQFDRGDVSPGLLWRVCVHEAGHALAASAFGRRVELVSALKTGPAGARAVYAGLEDGATREDLENDVAISLAGLVAEKLILGSASTGSHADLAVATRMMAALHGSFGLGASLARRIEPGHAEQLLGERPFRELIEAELQTIEGRCTELLSARVSQLRAVAEALRSKRVLGATEFAELVAS